MSEQVGFFQGRRSRENMMQVVLVAGLGFLALAFLLPFIWMISTSLKPNADTMKLELELIPHPFRWQNYLDAVHQIPFVLYTWNTVWVCVLSTAGTVLSSAMVAYAFAFLRWKGREAMFILTVATMMIPFPVLMVPLYDVFRSLHMIGTLTPLWLPAWFGSAWNIFLMRQFFLGIPKDLLDAARIDGCTEWQIFWRIIMPLAKTVLIVVGLFSAIYSWNDFLAPLLYLTKQEHYTLSLGLQMYQSKNGGTEWAMLMAASTLVMLPILILFMAGQRSLVRGITMTGIKM